MTTEQQCRQLEVLASNPVTAETLQHRIEESPRLSAFLLDIYYLACQTTAANQLQRRH